MALSHMAEFEPAPVGDAGRAEILGGPYFFRPAASGSAPDRLLERPNVPDPANQPVRTRDAWGRQTCRAWPSSQPDVLRAAAIIASRQRSTSSSVVAHEHTLILIALLPCQTVPPHQHVPSRWISAIVRFVVSDSPNDTRT